MATMKDEFQKRTGVAWKQVKGKSLSEANQKLYKQYVDKFQEANTLGRQLREGVATEWNSKYPSGMNGQTCSFNAIGGVLLYAMQDKKQDEKGKRVFDADKGDDVFARP